MVSGLNNFLTKVRFSEELIIPYFYNEKPFPMRPFRTPLLIILLFLCYRIYAQPETKIPGPVKYDISHEPVLYTVGYAHLDTEWRWDYPETINQ